ncbi:MAG: hypothetical protein JXA89_16220 [Anaerolineae bacterium]|nr:hypothetical protein [Anaerolineae bacterium]
MLYEVQKYIVIHLLRRQDPVGARRYKERSLQMAIPLVRAAGDASFCLPNGG